MADVATEASFPVIFFDGSTTTGVGTVSVQPSLNYKAFQSIISEMIGVSRHQITIYFERAATSMSLPWGKVAGRRIPVTNRFNFAGILRETDCFFFIVSKRSRRGRRRRSELTASESASRINEVDINSPDSVVLLHRNPSFSFSPPNSPYLDQFALANLEHSDQVRRFLDREKERYMTTLNLNSNAYSDPCLQWRMGSRNFEAPGRDLTSEDDASSSGGISSSSAGPDGVTAACDVCFSAEMAGQTAPFHLCVYDAILTSTFRSPAGPIARPSKRWASPPG